MRIVFLAYTSKTYSSCGITIERADLTRKLSCLETWVPRIESLGHEVIFFDGDSSTTAFDKKNKVLHTTANESYDYDHLKEQHIGSLMFERLKAAISWVLENRDFDYVFRIDDGSYVNAYVLDKIIQELSGCDVMMGPGGGAGMFFSKKACEQLIQFDNEKKIHIEDIAIWSWLSSANLVTKHSSLLCHQYVLSENNFTIHYTNGKRQYTTDTIISYYYNKAPLDRRIVLNYTLDYLLPLSCNTWDSQWDTTPLFYSFDKDQYNWEHYGVLARANFPVTMYCPFAEHSIKELFFYETKFDFNKIHEVEALKDYIKALKAEGRIYFFYKEDQIQNKILNFLELENLTDYVNIDIDYLANIRGNFYTLKKQS